MQKVINFINKITKEYGYKPLPADKSKLAREWYIKHLPDLTPNKALYTHDGIKIAEGFDRVVIGDYGAYIEIDTSLINTDVLQIKKGQEFRLQQGFKGKYIWLTTASQQAKIYKQIGRVSYADYKINKYYISPYEVYQHTRD